MTGLRDRKKSKVRTAIYAAAVRLFEAQGYDAVSVERIAAEAGIAKGTFFNHFSSKADILAAWHESLRKAGAVREEAADPSNLREALLAPVLATLRFAHAHPVLWSATIRETTTNTALRRLEATSDEQMRSLFARSFALAQAKGTIPSNTDPDTLAALTVTLLTGSVREWVVLQTRPCPLDEQVTARLDAFLNAIGYTQPH